MFLFFYYLVVLLVQIYEKIRKNNKKIEKMQKSEKLQVLMSIYEDLVAAGKVKTKGEMAELLGVSRSTLSSAMNGHEDQLTDSLILKAKALRRREVGAPVETHHGAPERNEAAGGIFIPKETLALYESLARTAENLTAIVSRLMPGGMPLEGKKAGTSPD